MTYGWLILIAFFALHWYASAFAQSFFLHRYCSHGMFTMSKGWERFFFLFTWFAQGSSFLNPRAYALMHREHHAYSDTEDDPHSPHFFREVFSMMWHTKKVYEDILRGRRKIPAKFAEKLPTWPSFERVADSWITRLVFLLGYIALYVVFAPSFWWYLLIPVHALMGPVHGAFVNWCGHMYGYRNYDLPDHSHNTFRWDVFFMGECFQNNHHRYPKSANFAQKSFEKDITYPVILSLQKLRIIRLVRPTGGEAW